MCKWKIIDKKETNKLFLNTSLDKILQQYPSTKKNDYILSKLSYFMNFSQ